MVILSNTSQRSPTSSIKQKQKVCLCSRKTGLGSGIRKNVPTAARPLSMMWRNTTAGSATGRSTLVWSHRAAFRRDGRPPETEFARFRPLHGSSLLKFHQSRSQVAKTKRVVGGSALSAALFVFRDYSRGWFQELFIWSVEMISLRIRQ